MWELFSRWWEGGVPVRVHATLRDACRARAGRHPAPSVAILDSQSVCEDHRQRGPRGFDAGKKVKGCKRHLLVDRDGLLLACRVHAADVQERAGAMCLLRPRTLGRSARCLRLIWWTAATGERAHLWPPGYGHAGGV